MAHVDHAVRVGRPIVQHEPRPTARSSRTSRRCRAPPRPRHARVPAGPDPPSWETRSAAGSLSACNPPPVGLQRIGRTPPNIRRASAASRRICSPCASMMRSAAPRAAARRIHFELPTVEVAAEIEHMRFEQRLPPPTVGRVPRFATPGKARSPRDAAHLDRKHARTGERRRLSAMFAVGNPRSLPRRLPRAPARACVGPAEPALARAKSAAGERLAHPAAETRSPASRTAGTTSTSKPNCAGRCERHRGRLAFAGEAEIMPHHDHARPQPAASSSQKSSAERLRKASPKRSSQR